MMRDKPDANADEIAATVEACGFTPYRIQFANRRPGCPDLLCIGHGVAVLAEIKRPGGPRGGVGGKLSVHQQDFIARCARAGVEVYVFRCRNDVVRALIPLRRRGRSPLKLLA